MFTLEEIEKDVSKTLTVKELKEFLDKQCDNDRVYFSRPYSFDKYRVERLRNTNVYGSPLGGIVILEGTFV